MPDPSGSMSTNLSPGLDTLLQDFESQSNAMDEEYLANLRVLETLEGLCGVCVAAFCPIPQRGYTTAVSTLAPSERMALCKWVC